MSFAPVCWRVPPRVSQEIPFPASLETRLTRLVHDAHQLEVMSYKFAMLCLAASFLPGRARAKAARQAFRDMSASWTPLRNTRVHHLDGSDPTLIEIMEGAFTLEARQLFESFDTMAQDLCDTLAWGDTPKACDLTELTHLVSHELSEANASIAASAHLVARMGRKEIELDAMVDHLTGLPNRRALYDLLCRTESTGWPHDKVALLHVDLDHLKHINEKLGQSAGDAALKHAAEKLVEYAGKDGYVARLGGDEFVMILFRGLTKQELSQCADGLLASISEPFLYEGKEHRIGASIGIVCGEEADGLALDRYLLNADLAVSTVKEMRRGSFRFFTPNLRAERDEKQALYDQIREGLDAQQFEPHFQPQIDGRTGKVVGFEALARWHHPTRGLLAPVHFPKAADEAGLLERLDNHIMDRAFLALRDWRAGGFHAPQVSINLTSARLQKFDLVETILFAVDAKDLSPEDIGIEILESAMIDESSDQLVANIHSLSDAGFKVELDDFGTGHASISNLRNFTVDRIKIDRSFVTDVHLYPELSKITAAMISLAHSLRVDALAEGVETPEERLVLNALGCDHIQGFGVARAMPGEEVTEWVAKTQKPKSLPPARREA